jgi:hypothetical protein
MRKNLNNESVRVEDISINVTCPECARTYDVKARGSNFTKTCRCGRGAFYITIIPMVGVIEVLMRFQDNIGEVKNVEPNDVVLDRK